MMDALNSPWTPPEEGMISAFGLEKVAAIGMSLAVTGILDDDEKAWRNAMAIIGGIDRMVDGLAAEHLESVWGPIGALA